MLQASRRRTSSNSGRLNRGNSGPIDSNQAFPETRKLKQSIRELVWNTHVGSKHGMAWCFACGATQISPFRFECGHIKARARGGLDSIENLLPICGLCNRSMGTMNLYDFQRSHGFPVKRRRFFRWILLVLAMILAWGNLWGNLGSPMTPSSWRT
jgi:hypothetical protein